MIDQAASRRVAVLSGHLHHGGMPDTVPVSAQRTSAVTGEPLDKSNPACTPQRAVIVAGVRTPFVKAFGDLIDKDAIDLGVAAVGGLINKTRIDPKLVDEVVWGNVVVNSAAPNIAREIIIDLNLPRTTHGVTVSRACLSGLQAVMQAVASIEHGDAEVIIAGGSDSTSSGEMPVPKRVSRALGKYAMGGGKKKGARGVREMLKQAGPLPEWLPKANSIAERSTGKTMGYHADLMAELNKVTRKEQDDFAIASHRKAAAAVKSGKMADEVVPVYTKRGPVAKDNIIRGAQDPARVGKLRPVFRKSGTVTAANASPLTDGASAVLVMSEAKARELGFPTDVVVRSYSMTAIDPFPQLLLAPAVAIPKALENGGISLSDINIFEIHEAFAAQVLSTVNVLKSKEFAQRHLGRSEPVGDIPLDKVNPNGGSIAIGHPFAATGGRLVGSLTNELRRSGARFGLISVCAAGGLGGVMILERRDA